MYKDLLNTLKKRNDNYHFSMDAYGELLDGHKYLNDKDFVCAVAELVFKAAEEIEESKKSIKQP